MIDKAITPGKILLSAALCLILLSAGTLFTSCKNEQKPADSEEAAETQNENKFEDVNEPKEDDSEILVEAAGINLAEIEVGKLAQTKSTNANVKKYADMLVADHTKAYDELKKYAESQNISLPLAITEDGKKHVDDLNQKTGKDFDKKFAEMMVEGHEDAIGKMEKASTDANNPDVKTWAANQLPTLKAHLEAAKTLKDQVK